MASWKTSSLPQELASIVVVVVVIVVVED